MISFYSAAMGGVWTTAEDLAKFAQAIFIDKNAVKEESLTEMMNIYTPIAGEPLVAGYGLGIYKFSPELFNGLEIWGHGGDAPGFAAAWMYLPDYNICIGIEDNTEDGNTMWVLNDLIEILIEEMGT